jgi:hypothetical protein
MVSEIFLWTNKIAAFPPSFEFSPQLCNSPTFEGFRKIATPAYVSTNAPHYNVIRTFNFLHSRIFIEMFYTHFGNRIL